MCINCGVGVYSSTALRNLKGYLRMQVIIYMYVIFLFKSPRCHDVAPKASSLAGCASGMERHAMQIKNGVNSPNWPDSHFAAFGTFMKN